MHLFSVMFLSPLKVEGLRVLVIFLLIIPLTLGIQLPLLILHKVSLSLLFSLSILIPSTPSSSSYLSSEITFLLQEFALVSQHLDAIIRDKHLSFCCWLSLDKCCYISMIASIGLNENLFLMTIQDLLVLIHLFDSAVFVS